MKKTITISIKDNGFREKLVHRQMQLVDQMQWQFTLLSMKLDWMSGASTSLYTPFLCDCRKPTIFIDEFCR